MAPDASLHRDMAAPPEVNRSKSRERQREDTRQRIYDAAIAVFRRDGVAAARIDDIARAAGVSHGTFYFHFATKDEVLLQRMRAAETAAALAVEAIGVDARLTVVLEGACEVIATEWQTEPTLWPEVAVVALRDIPKRSLDGPHSPVSSALEGRFRAAMERGELRRVLPPSILADLFLINVFAALLAWSARPEIPLATALAGVVGLFLDGARGPAV